MEAEQRRARAPNFSSEEKRVCLELVKKYKDVVENKKTDGVSKRQKDLVWSAITAEFNSACPGEVKRKEENLKHFFENQKRVARKAAAQEKRETVKTGGGTRIEKDDPLLDITLSIVNEKTIFGLPSKFDGDSAVKTNSNIRTSLDNAENTMDFDIDFNFPTEPVKNFIRNNEEIIQNVPSVAKIQETAAVNSENRMEQPSTSSSYQKADPKISNKERSNGKQLPKQSSNRRRPTLNHTLNLTKKYEDLSTAKQEMTELQLSLARQQEQRENELFSLKKQVLLAELQKHKEEALYWRLKRQNEEIKLN